MSPEEVEEHRRLSLELWGALCRIRLEEGIRDAAERRIAQFSQERDRLIEQVAALCDPVAYAGLERLQEEVPSFRDRRDGRFVTEMIERRQAIAELMLGSPRRTATFGEVVAELKRLFGKGCNHNHAATVLGHPSFRKVSRGVYGLAEDAQIDPPRAGTTEEPEAPSSDR